MPRPVPDLDELRTTFDEYFDSLEPLRPGGQALVYKARRFKTSRGIPTDQAVAIKLYLEPTEDPRIESEIAAARDAKCETLVKVLSHGNFESSAGIHYRFVVWQFIAGTPLDTRLETGPCAPNLAAVIGRDVTLAINALWEHRIVHRDINPKNLIIKPGDESAVLIDLGLVKHVEQTGFTAPGYTWGTAGYLSPEQAAGNSLTCQSDIFSLGITLQQALLGSHPTNFDQFELLNGGRPTHEICPTAPVGLAVLIDRMLQQRPARRPQVAELTAEFEKLLELL